MSRSFFDADLRMKFDSLGYIKIPPIRNCTVTKDVAYRALVQNLFFSKSLIYNVMFDCRLSKI